MHRFESLKTQRIQLIVEFRDSRSDRYGWRYNTRNTIHNSADFLFHGAFKPSLDIPVLYVYTRKYFFAHCCLSFKFKLFSCSGYSPDRPLHFLLLWPLSALGAKGNNIHWWNASSVTPARCQTYWSHWSCTKTRSSTSDSWCCTGREECSMTVDPGNWQNGNRAKGFNGHIRHMFDIFCALFYSIPRLYNNKKS